MWRHSAEEVHIRLALKSAEGSRLACYSMLTSRARLLLSA